MSSAPLRVLPHSVGAHHALASFGAALIFPSKEQLDLWTDRGKRPLTRLLSVRLASVRTLLSSPPSLVM